jgi:uncharacterized Zn finger protein
MLQPVDPAALAQLTAELAATTYHQLLAERLAARIAELQADDVTDPYVAMKRRGQVEELQRILLPNFLQQLALVGLSRRALAEAAESPADTLAAVRREWWADPDDRRM